VTVVYAFPAMTSESSLLCDGCGQAASAEHVARRLQRLEWTTRYRPIHVGTLLLGAVAPEADSEFLYAPETKLQGESRTVLEAAGVTLEGKSLEGILTEFQRGGFLLTHILECPLEHSADDPVATAKLLEQRLPLVAARIRRSLKPKCTALISRLLDPFVQHLESAGLGCAVLLDGGKAFALEVEASDPGARLRKALGFTAAAR